ncbi:MAG: ATP-binding protein [Pseudomonadota bacterium]
MTEPMQPDVPTPWATDAKYKTLFDLIDEGFCVVRILRDAQGAGSDYVFVEANPSFERQTGLKDAVGRSMRSLAPAHEEHWFRTYAQIAATGKALRFEAPADALGRWYDVYAFRLGEPGDDLVGILFNDITPRKELERENAARLAAIRQAQATIERQNAALREADARKDRFLATLSHELRNPLAPLKMAADLLGRGDLTDEQVLQTRGIVQRQVGQMALLLDDLLDVARITQGKLVLRRQPTWLADVVDSAVETVGPLVGRKRHALDIALEEPAALLDGDPLRLAQILVNLLTNAAKYTDDGGRIALEARVRDGWVVIDVRDDGIGIAPEALPTVFEMFSQQQAAAARSEGGLGIGLALVRGLAELHGGTVEAASEGLGRGSRFTVRLPAGPASASALPSEAGTAGNCGMRILVADDNRDAADTLSLLLGLMGHEVRTAYDGTDALAAGQDFRPAIAILDIGMPGMNGYEVARALRAQPWAASLLLVAATGWGDEAARRKALEAGFDRHLVKPVSVDAFEELLRLRP